MADSNLEDFKKHLKELDITLSENQFKQFLLYYDILIEWNQFINLTAITEFDEVVKKHFIDSLSLVKAYDLSKPVKIIDVGTGAGFPGIPLKIAFPHLEITLIDSLNKRINFLNEIIQKLGLKNIEAVHGRAEDFARLSQRREKFDLCVSRAVANLSTLCEFCLPFVKKDGYFISYKSEKIKQESIEAEKAISILGGKIEREVEFYFTDEKIYRNLFMIKKVKLTPKQFPRKAGTPTKEPIQ